VPLRDGDNFFTLDNGVKTATPLLLCLCVIELSDVVFAVDSIPAVGLLSFRVIFSIAKTVLSRFALTKTVPSRFAPLPTS
jgi:predicted tellurium resistance membrane protein TerC